MKRTLLLLSLALLSVGNIVAQNLVSGIYIGGHIRRERPGTIATLRTHVPQGTVVVLKVGKMSRKVRM